MTIPYYGFVRSRLPTSVGSVIRFRQEFCSAATPAGSGAIAATLVALAAATAACLPQAATAEGRDVSALYSGFVAIAVVIGAIVFGGTTWSVLRYRRRRGETLALPPQTRGSLVVESIWTAIPVLIVVGLFVATLVVLNRVQAVSQRPGASIRVEAFRWGWTFRYPNDGITVSGVGDPGPEIYVPVGEPIQLTLTAADVVHSFYVPQFLFKRDAVPGRESTFQFTVDDPGAYRGQCAEYCGIYHSRMPFTVRAVSRADYDTWIARQPKSSAGASASGPAGPGSAQPSGSGPPTLSPAAP
jgi:cytochrome c oxidase subunit II